VISVVVGVHGLHEMILGRYGPRSFQSYEKQKDLGHDGPR